MALRVEWNARAGSVSDSVRCSYSLRCGFGTGVGEQCWEIQNETEDVAPL